MKKEEKTERTRNKILMAALQEFGENGYDAATINHMCAKHEIAKGLIYHNYKNKEALYLCCADYAVGKFMDYMQGQAIGSDLRRYMLLRYRFMEENPQLGRIVLEVVLRLPEVLPEGLKEIKAKFDGFNLQLYTRAIEGLRLRPGVTRADAVAYYNLLQNMLNGYLCNQTLRGDAFATAIRRHEEQLETILNYMLYGIAIEDGAGV